jgi:hypothetical protein
MHNRKRIDLQVFSRLKSQSYSRSVQLYMIRTNLKQYNSCTGFIMLSFFSVQAILSLQAVQLSLR